MAGLISLFLGVQNIKHKVQMDLFLLINPFKPGFLPSSRQTLPWDVAFPKFEEASTLPELFLIEQQFVWLTADVIAETDGGESALYVHFYHGLFKIMIYLDN
jgi:hypothetical protein